MNVKECLKMKKKNLKRIAGLGGSMAAVLLQPSAFFDLAVSAEELEYEGTTQILSTDYFLEQILAVELEVEEVYVEEGSQVQKGDALLKFTDESWQDALDYYEAAVLRAEGELTNTQMEYDQGILEAEYTIPEDSEASRLDSSMIISRYSFLSSASRFSFFSSFAKPRSDTMGVLNS